MGTKIIRRPGEPIGLVCRRLKKQCARDGLFRELRSHEYYMKPCEKRRQKIERKKVVIQRAKEGKSVKPKPDAVRHRP